MNISRENETNNIESELKRRIKQWAEQEGLEVPKDFEQIAELTKIKYIWQSLLRHMLQVE